MTMRAIPQTSLGAWMRKQREAKGVTRKQTALRAGVEINTVHHWEVGRQLPRLGAFIGWCGAVAIAPEKAISTVEKLLEGEQL